MLTLQKKQKKKEKENNTVHLKNIKYTHDLGQSDFGFSRW